MNLEAIYHKPKSNWAYAYDRDTIHLRIRTKKNNIEKVDVIYGDKYDWKQTKEQKAMVKMIGDSLFDYWHVAVQPRMRRMRYCFLLQNEKESLWLEEAGFTQLEPLNSDFMFDFPYINPIDVLTPPKWVKDAVFYQIFPDRFANGDPLNDPKGVLPWGEKPTRSNFFGGDLQGVIDHLDYLVELGITGIYFNPLFEATLNHKYDTIDYFKVDPQFGDTNIMKQLVIECHKRGIRVMLDVVFNHCGELFPPFIDVVEKGSISRYANWFHVNEWPITIKNGVTTYETFAYNAAMPKLNTEDPDLKAYLLEVARYWTKEIGIDGWRLDVANEVDHHFWREFRKTVKDINPDVYILGEIFHDSLPWLQGDQFDAVMNYPLTTIMIEFAVKGSIDGRTFADRYGTLFAGYPMQANEVAFNIIDSHDTPRLLHRCEGDKRKMKLASFLQFVLPGTPCIYYGDEIGMEGGPDPDCRKCMEWNEDKQDRDLFQHYKKLIELRKDYKVLRTGTIQFLSVNQGDQKLIIERCDEKDYILILLNASEDEESFFLNVNNKEFEDILTGEKLLANSGVTKVVLPSKGFSLLIGTKK